MKKLTLLTAVLALCCAFSCAEEQPQLQDDSKEQVMVIAHRGDWRNTPENSIQAIENCIEMGVDMVEIDVSCTKDGHIILLHDKTLDRTTTGKGLPSDYTLAQIKQMRLRNGANSATHHQIPTLEEAMRVCKDRILVNVDKGHAHFDKVIEILERTQTVDQCVIKSSAPYEQMRSQMPQALDNMLFMPVIKIDTEGAQQIYDGYKQNYKPYAYEIVFKEYNEQVQSIVKDMIESGAKIWVNSLWDYLCAGHHDDRAVELDQADQSWGWILDTTGATLIQTDRPEELIDYLQKRGQHK